jgi:hypothetical protein
MFSKLATKVAEENNIYLYLCSGKFEGNSVCLGRFIYINVRGNVRNLALLALKTFHCCM